jgi:L-alanine-DL-glutamate epimerase-like enolase superfamily enzyme
MRIVDIREMAIPLHADIRNAVISFADHTVSLVAVVSDVVRGGRPVVGVAFNSIGRYAQSGLLRERFLRRLMAADPETLRDEAGTGIDPAKAVRAMMQGEKPGGHGDRAHAVAAVELALWDLNAKLQDVPAWRLIAAQFGIAAPARAPVYAAGGYYYPGADTRRIGEEMRRYADLGYRSFKMKIGGASLSEDMARIEAAVAVAGRPDRLAVDANGRFDLETARAYAKAIEPLGLRWYEEPGDPLDFHLTRELAEDYGGALATGENLFSVRDAVNLMRFGGMRPGRDIFQMDPGLSYGLGEYGRMVAALTAAGFQRQQLHPHGGHMIALHIAMGLDLGGCESYPGVFAPVGGYTPACVIDGDGIAPGPAPGFGLEEKPDLAPHIARLRGD